LINPDLKDNPTGKLAALGQHSSGLDQFLREVDAVDPAAVAVRKVSRWPADTTANVKNPAVLRNCDALSLIASSSQTQSGDALGWQGFQGLGSVDRVPVQ
jgi:hypothetical protein